MYGVVRRLAALKRLFERRGSLTSDEATDALAEMYYEAHDATKPSAQRTFRRDLAALRQLGFRITSRRYAGNRFEHWWGDAPLEPKRKPRFRKVCDRCGKYFWVRTSGYHRYCPRCKRERQKEMKAQKRSYARARYQARK